MTEREDERLDQAVRGALLRRDPGPAPVGLRERVANLPEAETASTTRTQRLSRAAIPALGLAAAILLLVIATPLLAPRGVGPGASAEPGTTFDPSLKGPGLVAPPLIEAEGLVVLGLLIAGAIVLAVAPAGPRRAGAVLVALLILGFGGSQILLTHAVTGPVASSGGIGVLNVEQTEPGGGRHPVYITAAPGEPFSFGFSVQNEGPLPIRLEGVVADPAEQDPRIVGYPTLRAVWATGAIDGDIVDPRLPFAGANLAPDSYVYLWLVGTAPRCAFGPAFDAAATGVTDLVGMPVLRVEYKRPRAAPNCRHRPPVTTCSSRTRRTCPPQP